MILRASKGHLLTQIPQPIQRGSLTLASLEVGSTSIQREPDLLMGQDFLHSYLHFLGLHLSSLIIAILNLSSMAFSQSIWNLFFLWCKKSFGFFFSLLFNLVNNSMTIKGNPKALNTLIVKKIIILILTIFIYYFFDSKLRRENFFMYSKNLMCKCVCFFIFYPHNFVSLVLE